MEIEPTGSALAIIGTKLAFDVLGPGAQYLGEEIKGLAALGVKNIKRVFEHAKTKEDSLHISDGSVPSRILPPLLRSAYYCEDEVVASYLGGILCSSRSRSNYDDRGISIIRAIDGLSSYSLRAHCIIYASLQKQKAYRPEDIKKWLLHGHGVTICFKEDDLRSQMKLSPEEDADAIMEHAFVSLSASDLLSEGIRITRLHKEQMNMRWMRPTLRGVELFAWGCGFGQNGISPFFSGVDISGDTALMAIEPIKVDLGMVSYG